MKIILVEVGPSQMTIPPITKAEDLVERMKISFMTDVTAPAEEKPLKKQQKRCS